MDARVDYDPPDGKQQLTFAGGYALDRGVQHGGLGGAQGDMTAGYGKVDYVCGALRITGYVNLVAIDQTFIAIVDPAGQPLPWDVKSRKYHVEFGDSRELRAKRAKHLISYGANFRHIEFNIPLAPGAKSRNEGGAYFQDEIFLSEHFRWVVGARVDKCDILKDAVFSPRTTFMVKPAPGQTFRVSYNRA